MEAGPLADRPGVPIGAMVVACWIMPLQAMAFAMVWGQLSMELLRSLQAPLAELTEQAEATATAPLGHSTDVLEPSPQPSGADGGVRTGWAGWKEAGSWRALRRRLGFEPGWSQLLL